LNLKYDKLVSNLALNCNLRHYIKVKARRMCEDSDDDEDEASAGRCRLTLGFRS